MVKHSALVFILTLSSFFAAAQGSTRAGTRHAVDFGLNYGYSYTPGTGQAGQSAGLFLDFNALRSHFRTRLDIRAVEIQGGGAQGQDSGAQGQGGGVSFSPAAALDFMLLAGKKAFYFYPLLGGGVMYDAGHTGMWTNDIKIYPEAGLGFELQFTRGFGMFVQGKYRFDYASPEMSDVLGQAGFIFAFGHRNIPDISSTGTDLAANLKASDDADDAVWAEKVMRARSEAARKAESERQAAQQARNEAAASEAEARRSERVLAFPRGSAFLNEEARAKISELVEFLKEHPEATVEINGYAYRDGSNERTDKGVSGKRAEAVKNFLLAYGIPEYLIKTNALGTSADIRRAVVIRTY